MLKVLKLWVGLQHQQLVVKVQIRGPRVWRIL